MKTIAKFKCDHCATVLTTKYSLLRHIRTCRSAKIVGNMKTMAEFTCYHCASVLTTKYNLLKHIKAYHLPSTCNQRRKFNRRTILCIICNENCLSEAHFEKHLESAHQWQVDRTKLEFVCEKDFYEWKEQEEIRSKSFFALCRTNKSKNNNKKYLNFVCNRSGISEKRNTGKRMTLAKGYCRNGSHCLARINAAFQENGRVEVAYCSTHTGHEKQLCYLHLPPSQEKMIASKIQQGVSLDQILDEIRDDVISASSLQKRHYLTKKNLFNIMQKYHISEKEKYHQNDTVNVNTLLNKWERNPFIMFKNQDEEHEILGTNDIMIILMTDTQVEVLKLHGSKIICIDATHSTNQYDVQLVSLVVIDEFGEGFPAAFCISNRIDEVSMTVFFQQIKRLAESVTTNVFMSDGAPFFYNCWENVMGEVPCKLLCKWHIDRNWKENLTLLPNKKTKCEVYATLRLLLEEPDNEQFFCLLSTFLQQLREAKCDSFCDYFTRIYCNRVNEWAACYQTQEFLNTNMAFEAFHNVLKHIYLKSVKNHQIDILIHNLLKISRDKCFNRLVHLEEGHGNHFLNEVNNRHRRYKEVTNITQISPNEWQVGSVSKKNIVFYTVESDVQACDCEQKCLICDICVHVYSCTCRDYLIKHNMCKHIHAIKMLQIENNKSNDSSSSRPTSPNVMEDAIDDDVCKELDMNKNNIKLISRKAIVQNMFDQVSEMWRNLDPKVITEELYQNVTLHLSEITNMLSKKGRSPKRTPK